MTLTTRLFNNAQFCLALIMSPFVLMFGCVLYLQIEGIPKEIARGEAYRHCILETGPAPKVETYCDVWAREHYRGFLD